MNAQLQPKRKAVKAKVRRDAATHQHYATFSLELLMNDDNTVRRTKLAHLQSGVAQTWSEWEPSTVIEFVEVNGLLPQELTGRIAPNASQPEVSSSMRASSVVKESAVKFEILGARREDELDYCQLMQRDQSYALQLALEWEGDKPALGAKVKYEAVAQAKLLGTPKLLRVGVTVGIAAAGERVLIDVSGARLPPGTYRLSAALTLRRENAIGNGSELVLLRDGGLLNVY
jgi:hypothetical protein